MTRAPLIGGAPSMNAIDYEPLPLAPRRSTSLSSADRQRLEAAQARLGWLIALLKLLSTCVAGVLIGATAAAMHDLINPLVVWRNSALQFFYQRSLAQAFGAQLAISCGLAVAGSLAVQMVAPLAAGGGVPMVMAWLNGNSIPGLFAPRVFVVKFFGTVAALGAGMCLGMEAPMVHLGSAVANAASSADQRLTALLLRQRWLLRLAGFRSVSEAEPEIAEELAIHAIGWHIAVDRREAVSAGAGAGIASAFGAPIGGVLFSLEEACSVWSRRIAWRCFLACAIATITHSTLNPHSASGLLSADLRPLRPNEWLQQLPAILAVGAGGGLLGAVFNKLRLLLRPWRAKAKHHGSRIQEVAVVAALTSATVAGLAATVGRCLPVPDEWAAEPMWVQHTCAAGQYNDLATAWLAPAVWSIRTFISLGTKSEPLAAQALASVYYSPRSLAAMCLAYLPLMGLSAALSIPGGLFMPSFLLGGSGGALAGLALRSLAPPGWRIQPGLYALCGATAVLGGVFRSSISTVVLITESCGTLAPLVGVIASVCASNAVAVLCGTEGVYESELEASLGLNYLSQAPPRALRPLVAEQLMSSPAQGLPCIVPVAAAEALLRRSRHNGFPVYDPAHVDTRAGSFRLDGFIMRSQVELLLQERVHCDRHGRYLQAPPQGLDVLAWEDRLATAMAAQLQRYSNSSAGNLLRLASRGVADPAAAEGGGGGGSGALRRTGSMGSSGSAALLADHPSPFDNQEVEPHLNLGPFLNRAPATVRLETPATRVHSMMLSLSLRHIVVVDENNYAVGIVTRRDLAHAAGSRLGRERTSWQPSAMELDALLERHLSAV
ncbi:family transporter: chloride ion channel [Chlorella sorokiniana]|uniref:Chloride channel protein n=1 Tax=Chlorella sorokiniana TaxID=3076 RepID=A0A2P6TMD3_CHLSO|nr:family transporter: chloride ion channel [Chlorella sorokiniana]|eukprot:PRW45494.1 family transporter: chloride ion channel [Chlorella sorokiniana]